MMTNNIWVTFGIVLLGSGLCLAQSDPPSLGELAKRNKTTSKAEKVFTDADLPSRKAEATEAVVPAAAQNASHEATAAAGSPDKKESAKQTGPATKDSPAVAELKKQIASYQQDEDMWKKSASRYESLLADETNDFRRETYQGALDNDRKNVAFYQEKIDQAQSALANAQKSGSSAPSASSTGQP